MRINVLGVGFDNVTMAEAVDRGMELLRQEGAHYVVTPNPEIVEVCRENPEAMEAVNGADLVLADGIGVIKGAAMLGTPLKERTPGVEFAAHLVERMAGEGKSLYLLGGKPGVAETAATRLTEKYPDASIVGINDGYFKNDAEIIEKINASGADILFVCLGAPKQEKWIFANKDKLKVSLAMGLGGSLDVYAGTVKRAPDIFIKLNLEWFYRLLKQPKRIGRMMNLPKFLFGTIFYKLSGKDKKNSKKA